jgi:hypothetical protein
VALERRITVAKGGSSQCDRVADFLLAWWNGADCGRFGFTSLWGLEPHIGGDIVTAFGLISQLRSYPDRLDYEADFKEIIRVWRPHLAG